MSVTLIIPTISETTLEKVVLAAKKELPEAEIIVAGFGPSGEIAKRNEVEFFDTKYKTPKSIIINKVVELAKNDWIIVLDADAIPQNGWGQNMLATFKAGKKIFGGSVDISEGNLWMKVYNLSSFHEFLPENKAQKRYHLPAISLGFTKDAFHIGGKWNESLSRSQDYEWTLRLFRKGLIPWFEPDASILHIPETQNTFKKIWLSWIRNGYYNWVVRELYGDTLGTPRIIKNPIIVLFLSPVLAIIPTLRILKTSPKNFFKYFYLLPFVYLTKIAWCIGVFKGSRGKK